VFALLFVRASRRYSNALWQRPEHPEVKHIFIEADAIAAAEQREASGAA
jgi:hypothetical protein